MLIAKALAIAAAAASFANVHTFAFGIGDGGLTGDLAAKYADYDLVVVDGEGVTPAQVSTLHADGKLVLGYLDVGTIERGRSWYVKAKRYKLEYWPDWGEWYADTSAPGYRDLLAKTVAPKLLKKGLDGLFLDNVDMISNHRRQASGMRSLIKSLSTTVHAQDKVLFAQNGDDIIGPFVRYLDGWNREDVSSTYDFDRKRYVPVSADDHAEAIKTLARLRAKGLLVTATDYQDAGSDPSAAIAAACAAGAIPYVSDIGLTRIPARAPRC